MKQFLLAVLFLVTTSPGHATFSPGHAWKKILDCNAGAAVIDRLDGGYHGIKHQLVIRNGQIISYLASQRAIFPERVNEKGELIIPLSINKAGPAGELVGEADAFQSNGRVYFVKPINNGLLVEAFSTSQPTGGIYTTQQKMADWYFDSCVKN